MVAALLSWQLQGHLQVSDISSGVCTVGKSKQYLIFCTTYFPDFMLVRFYRWAPEQRHPLKVFCCKDEGSIFHSFFFSVIVIVQDLKNLKSCAVQLSGINKQESCSHVGELVFISSRTTLMFQLQKSKFLFDVRWASRLVRPWVASASTSNILVSQQHPALPARRLLRTFLFFSCKLSSVKVRWERILSFMVSICRSKKNL